MTLPAFNSESRHTLVDAHGETWVQVDGKLYANRGKTAVRHVDDIQRLHRRSLSGRGRFIETGRRV